MKLKILAALVTLYATNFDLIGQMKKVKTVEYGKQRNGYYIGKNILIDKEDFLVHTLVKKMEGFEIFDMESMQREGSFQFAVPEKNGKEPKNTRMFYKNEEVTYLYSYYDKTADEYTVYARRVNKKGKDVLKERKIAKFNAEKKSAVGSVVFYYSRNYSKILVVRQPNTKRYETDRIEVALVDAESLENIYTRNIAFPFKGKNLSVNNIMVSDSGRVILTAEWVATKSEIKEDPELKDKLFFKIFGIDPLEKEMRNLSFEEAGLTFDAVSGVENPYTGKISFVGVYRDDKKALKGANGLLYFEINEKEWTVQNKKFIKIDNKMMSEILAEGRTSERTQKRADKSAASGIGMMKYLLREIYTDTQGNLSIIMEKHYLYEVCTQNKNGVQTCRTHFVYGQIIQFNLDNNGDLNNCLLIPKYADLSAYINTGGYFSITDNEHIYYIFNDNDKNYNPKRLAKNNNNAYAYSYGSPMRSRLAYAYGIEGKGKAKSKKMAYYSDRKTNIYVSIADVAFLNSHTAITFGIHPKTKMMYLMKFAAGNTEN